MIKFDGVLQCSRKFQEVLEGLDVSEGFSKFKNALLAATQGALQLLGCICEANATID